MSTEQEAIRGGYHRDLQKDDTKQGKSQQKELFQLLQVFQNSKTTLGILQKWHAPYALPSLQRSESWPCTTCTVVCKDTMYLFMMKAQKYPILLHSCIAG